ncbi:unnamed protein product [Rotaria sp. Silwood1]|nr:unnamed protein product [Rotaria sp. Silwood1]CAF3430203.1 unnamed protein product [Rotaria sp. Silwood1]CAF4708055.1 unnamed protein product [Rotaria sp. Silwood1]
MFKNYLFGLKRTNKNGNQIWICTHKLCNASIVMREGLIVKTSSIKSDGSHEFQHQRKLDANVYECIRSIKRRIDEDPATPVSVLYEQQVKKFRRENGAAGSVPVFDRVRSCLYEYRSSKHPPVPKSLSSIEVPYRLTRTLLDDRFLLNHNRTSMILTFSSLAAMKLLGNNEHWNADGTFRTAPRLFYQSFSIHVWDAYSMKSAIYAALPDKKENTYDNFLQDVILYANNYDIKLAPKTILIDFEVALYKSFSNSFPTAIIKGCQFHFSQNIWRQIKKKGLLKLSQGEDVRRQIANILMLPILPPDEINNAFCNIIEHLSNIHVKFLKLTNYILETYIEEPLYPRSFWNLFDLIGIRPKTNNHIEGYHGQLNSHCPTHPTIWSWIRYIQEAEESVMIRLEQEHEQLVEKG